MLEGKTAIITGASSGIGAAAAKLFGDNGSNLVLGARRRERLVEVSESVRSNGGRAVVVDGDVCEEAFAEQLVETALSNFGSLDIALNNAGTLGAITEITAAAEGDWNRTLRTNLTSGFFAAKHQLKPMLEAGGGSIIFVSSFVGNGVGLPGMSAYAASKAGLVGMTQCLAAEYGPRGIRVNALLPGGVDTPMKDAFATDADAMEAVAAMHALKRIAKPEEVAQAALFLASDAASFVTGSAMLVDGGNTVFKT